MLMILQSEICSKNTRKNTRFVKNRDRMESLGNDDVSALSSPKYEMVRDDVKQKMPEETAWVDFVTFTAPYLYFYCFAFRLFGDIL